MAPQMPHPSTLVFDSRTQIIDNCEFLISKDDIVQVITSKDPADKFFRAYAVRCSSGDAHDVMLESEPCEDAQKAVQSLHTKSCEAIHRHITTNGFSGRRSLKPVFLEPDFEDEDDAASIISGHSDSSTAAFSEWGSSGDETMTQKHASDATAETSKERQRNAGRQGGSSRVSTATAAAHEPARASRSLRAAPRDFSDYANPAPPRARVARPGRSHSPSLAARQAPPPPPGHPGHHHGSDGPTPMPHMPPALRGMGMGMAMPPPPRTFPSNMTLGPPTSRPQNVANLPPMPSGPPFPCFRVPGIPLDAPPPFPLSHANSRPPKPPSPNANTNANANDGNRDRDRDGNGNGSGGSGSSSNPPRPTTFPVVHPTMRFYPVRITVRWLRHGQHRIIAQCHPTREALQSAAVADVQMNPGAFTSESNSNSNSKLRAASPNGRDRPNLRAQVRQAVFAGEAYDMRTFQGQDLSRLFNVMAADDSMPSFEVVVEDAPRDDDDDDDETEDDGDGEASVRTTSGPPKIERWD
ncbi:hypothetical protein F5Y14DRAFT_448362 [Nemania sp. NC0429]|nr:hypothetical protein F5Y14DRAFT_448362 [Nemania sp. NC0429]